jgi:CRP-like cAMP-binding protein
MSKLDKFLRILTNFSLVGGRLFFLMYYIVSLSFRYTFKPDYDFFEMFSFPLLFDYAADIFFLTINIHDMYLRIKVLRSIDPSMSPSNRSILPERRRSSLKRLTLFQKIATVDSKPKDDIATILTNKKKKEMVGILKYFSGYYINFFMEIFVLFPFEIISYLFGYKYYYWFRINRIFRLYFFFKYWNDFSHWIENHVTNSLGMVRFMFITVIMLLTGHVSACIFYYIALSDLKNGIAITWLSTENLVVLNELTGKITMNASISIQYIRALYWSTVCIMTVGYGDQVAWSPNETIYAIFYFYISAFLMYFSVSNLISLFSNMDSEKRKHLLKVTKFTKYAAYRGLSKEFIQKVKSYYEYQWHLYGGNTEKDILCGIPINLEVQISQYLVHDIIAGVVVFRGLSKTIINALVEDVEINLYTPKDIVIASKSVVNGIYIVSTGELENVNVSLSGSIKFDGIGEKSSIITKAQSFIVHGLIKPHVSNNYLIAKTFAEVLYLSGANYRRTCRRYMTKAEYEILVTNFENSEKSMFKRHNRLSGLSAIKNDTNGFRIKLLQRTLIRTCWDLSIFLCLCTYMFLTPLLIVGTPRNYFLSNYKNIFIVSYCIDIIVFIDTVLQATVFGYESEGIIVLDSTKIFTRYVTDNSIVIVALSVLPIDLFMGVICGRRLLPYIRLFKFLHIRNLNLYYTSMEDAQQRLRISASFEVLRFLTLYFLLFLLCHWVGSAWSLFGDVSTKLFGYDTNWHIVDKSNTFYYVDYDNTDGGKTGYLRSIYWALSSLGSIGFPDILNTNPIENSFVIVTLFLGCSLLNAIIGSIASLIGGFGRDEREFHKRVSRMKLFIARKKISPNVSSRIMRFFDYTWSRYGGVNEKEVLNNLPKALKTSIISFVRGPLLKNISFFKSCPEEMIDFLVSNLEPMLFIVDDYIINAGDKVYNFYIIEKGIVDIIDQDCITPLRTITDGDCFNEEAFFKEIVIIDYFIVAKSYCDTYYLSHELLLKFYINWPDEFKSILQFINEKLKKENESKLKIRIKTKEKSIRERPVAHSMQRFDSLAKHHLLKTQSQILENNDAFERTLLITNRKTNFIKNFRHPDSHSRRLWDTILCIGLSYYLFVIPLRLSVELNIHLFIIDFIIDFLFLIDSILHYSLFGQYREGKLMNSKKEIKEIYLEERMWIDVVSLFPFDLLVLLFTGKNILFWWALLRLPKLFRFLNGKHYFIQASKAIVEFLHIDSKFFDLVYLFFVIVLIGNWVACGFYFVASAYSNQKCLNFEFEECTYDGTWIELQIGYQKLPIDSGSQFDKYIRALNFAIPTLTTNCHTDVLACNKYETLFAFVTMFVGCCVNGAVLGFVGTLIVSVNDETADIANNIDKIRSFQLDNIEKDSKNSMPKTQTSSTSLTEKAASYLEFLLSPAGSIIFNQEDILNELPLNLRYEVDNIIITTPYLKRCPFFDHCDDQVLQGISLKMKILIFAAGDTIISYGELGIDMFFIESGSVQVVSGDKKTIYSTLEAGAFFGETALFFKSPRMANIIATSSVCILYRLTKEDIDNQLRLFNLDQSETLASFKNLQESNIKRNKATSENLIKSKSSSSKLFKILGPDLDSDRKSFLNKMRIKLHPDSKFRIVWDIVGLLSLSYLIISIPFFIAFLFGGKASTFIRKFLYLEVAVDLYFICDIILKAWLFSFKVDPVMKDLSIEADDIWKNYLVKGHFYLDVIASLPIEIIYFCFDFNDSPYIFFMLRVIHLLRASELLDYVALLEYHSKNIFGKVQRKAVVVLMKATLIYILLNHWMACIYFSIHRYLERDIELTYVIADGFATYDPITKKHDICNSLILHCYARSVYFVAGTMTAIGYGDISPYTNIEIMWEQCVAIFGSFAAATICGACSALIDDVNAEGGLDYRLKLEKLEKYMKVRDLPSNLKLGINSHFKYIWSKYKMVGNRSNSMLAQLSLPLTLEITFEMKINLINSVSILKNCDNQLQRRISTILLPQV